MWLDVDGKRMQNGSTKTMIFGVQKLVSYVSHFITLHAGDVIATGTPPGVGPGEEAEADLPEGWGRPCIWVCRDWASRCRKVIAA